MSQSLKYLTIWLLLLFNNALWVNASGSVSLSNKAELRTFGEQIEASINNNNPRYVNICFDGKALISNVIAQTSTVQDPAFNQGFSDGFLNSLDLGAYLVDCVLSGGNIKLIHVKGSGLSAKLLFRMISYETIDYYEFSIEELGGEFRITDFYVFSTGERLSENALALYKQQISSVYLKDRTTREHTHKINIAMQEGNPRKILRNWKKLPEGMRFDKKYIGYALQSACAINKKNYLSILEDFNTFYPQEPARYLIPLEGLIKYNSFEEALLDINMLEQEVYNDPVIDYIRANVYIKAGKTDQAIKCFDNLLKALPEFEMGYLSLLEVYLTKKQYAQAAKLVTEMSISLNTSKEAFIPYLQNYPEFVKSKAYRDLLTW